MNKKVLIIAEAGVNHNGDIDIAKKMIDAASNFGADIIKFQSFNAARLVTETAMKAQYQKNASVNDETQYEMLKRLELNTKEHEELKAHCEDKKIEFLSTGFDVESMKMLLGLGLKRIKIPSGEITNLPFLRFVGALKKEIILSTGMATLDEIGAAIKILEEFGSPRKNITVLHCTSEYPAPINTVNLNAIITIKDKFGVSVGYSDHTEGKDIAIAAVALGACVIEKHFTLDRNMPGPDHKASLVPVEMKSLVSSTRDIESALGDGLKTPTPGELANAKVVRKSVVAKTIIRKGDVFCESNLVAKRPGTGISPTRWDEIIGTKAPRDFNKDEVIDL